MGKILKVKVVVNSVKPTVIKMGKRLKVKVDAPREKGKANERLIEILSKYLNVRKNKIRILKGWKSENKIIEILD